MWDPRRKELEAQTCSRQPSIKLGSSIFQWYPKLGGCVCQSPPQDCLMNTDSWVSFQTCGMRVPAGSAWAAVFFFNVSLNTWCVVCISELGKAKFLKQSARVSQLLGRV